ncbi:MAG TPA: hypothetical protein GXX46_01045 [Peptococcaceae bacterium]|nr:hypothetical protein [Peptococcaceae bacterium]
MKERTQLNYAQRWRIEQSGKRQASQKRRLGNIFFAMLLILVILVGVFPWLWQYKLQHDLVKVEGRIKDYHEVEAVLLELERLQAEIAGMESFLRSAEARAKDPQIVLEQITALLPAGTVITSYNLNADYSVQIGLVLPGPVDVAKLWASFRDSGLFVDFDLNSVSLTDEVKTLNLTLKMAR